jgi:hypothetical protein
MTNQQEPNMAPELFGSISEADRRAVLDLFGKMVLDARDRAVLQWDQILSGTRKDASWERLLHKFPDLDVRSREMVKEILPNAVDTFMYCLLANLDGPEQAVQISVAIGDTMVENIARLSWGLPAEPAGDDGWLARFSKQRFEQPYCSDPASLGNRASGEENTAQ